MENEKSPLTVGINQKMSVGELLLFAVQHLISESNSGNQKGFI